MAANVRITKELKNPTEAGVFHRLICMTGATKGNVYYLTGKRVVIGRGDNADIQIVDTKISREHAELSFADGGYIITDLGAQNGVIVNDIKVKQKKLEDTEKIVIGQVVFKYNRIEISQSAEMVLAEAHPESALAKDIKRGVKVKIPPKNIKNNGDDELRIEKKQDPKENKSKMIIFGIILVAVIFVLFGDDSAENSKTDKKKSIGTADLEMFNETVVVKSTKDDAEVRKKVEALVHSGRREFREGNYFRAMEEFRLALLISPTNGHASFYLSKAKQRLDDEIKRNFEKGTQEQDAKKYQAAIVSFCGVVQLIKDYPNDERYKNAMAKISSIESSLGMEQGEVKCFEEKSADSAN